MEISKLLISWYLENRRDLPWRKTMDPYIIWVSEIILQQTKVTQGIHYFKSFIRRYPDIRTLATSNADDVMKSLQGLGYYSRVRNLYETAKYVTDNLDGKFPETYSGLIKLKGIGPYTAAAIASFAFNEKIPVVDGNVIRVLSRLFGIYTSGKSLFSCKAGEILDPERPALFNQALMEFGALQCTPRSPECLACPFTAECYAFRNSAIDTLPVKNKRKSIKNRFFHYFILYDNGKLILKKRAGKDIWKGLYDFPLIETTSRVSVTKLRKSYGWTEIFGPHKPEILDRSEIYRHILTHQVIYARFYLINKIPGVLRENPYYREIELKKVMTIPVPRLIENFLNKTSWLFYKTPS